MSLNRTPNQKIKWAILGTSPISQTMAKAINASSDAEIYAIGSRQMQNACTFAQKFNVPVCYDNLDRLLADPLIDAIYIGLPNSIHKEWIIKCAAAGKHILCEKPLVLDENEFDEIRAAVEKANVICLEALMYRHHPLIKKLQTMINDKVIGNVTSITARYTANIAGFANPTAGGATRNLGCYPISLIRLLMGTEPASIAASGKMNPEHSQYNIDNEANITLTFENGCQTFISIADNVEKSYQFEITGTQGTLVVDANPWMAAESASMHIINGDNTISRISVTSPTPLYTYQIDLVNSHIMNKTITQLNTEAFQHSRGNVMVIRESLDQVRLAQNAEPKKRCGT